MTERKTEIMAMKVGPNERATLDLAARVAAQPVSRFVREAALEAAVRTLGQSITEGQTDQ